MLMVMVNRSSEQEQKTYSIPSYASLRFESRINRFNPIHTSTRVLWSYVDDASGGATVREIAEILFNYIAETGSNLKVVVNIA